MFSFSDAEHKYPYDWRTKKPTIFRATEQWFASVEGFRHDAMSAIGHVKWFPPQVIHFILSFAVCLSICIIIFSQIQSLLYLVLAYTDMYIIA